MICYACYFLSNSKQWQYLWTAMQNLWSSNSDGRHCTELNWRVSDSVFKVPQIIYTYILYVCTRGPWTATPALFKVLERKRTELRRRITCKNNWKVVQISGKRHNVSVLKIVKTKKRYLFSVQTIARWSHEPKPNPARIDAQTHLYQPRCHLSSLI